MNRKKQYFEKPEVAEDETCIQGYGIEIKKDDVERIDRLVNNYESRIISHLDEAYLEKTTLADRLADKIAQFGGSWRFIIAFSILLAVWMGWNTLPLTRQFHFDAPPFILLNLCLSFIAAFQAPVIMMSQNRQAARDKNEALINFAIDYKAEQEIDDAQRQLHLIREEILEIKQLLRAMNKNTDTQ